MALIQWKQINPQLLGNGQLTGSLEVSGSIILNGVDISAAKGGGGGVLPSGVISGSQQITSQGFALTSSVTQLQSQVDGLSAQTSSYLTSIGTSNIQDLSNVDTTGISDGQILAYDSVTGNFIPTSAGQGDITAVYSGVGLNGGGTSGVVALEVTAGNGITANDNGVHLDTGSNHFITGVIDLSIFQQTGSYYSTTNELQVTGSLTLRRDDSGDALSVYNGDIKTFGISSEGVLLMATQSISPTVVKGGMYLDENYNLYIGQE